MELAAARACLQFMQVLTHKASALLETETAQRKSLLNS